MKKFWNLNNRGVSVSKGQIVTRRSDMKRRMIVGIVGGIALAAVIGTSLGLSNTGKVESVTSPAESVSAQLPNESFAYFSIEPGTSVMDGNTRVENDDAQLPNESFAYWSIEPGTSLRVDNAKVENDDAQLPNESFAYFSIEPGTSMTVGDAKVENDDAQLPLEPFAYWSIEPGRSIVGNAN